MHTTYDQNIEGKNYQVLIDLAAKNCDKFGLIIRTELFLNEQYIERFYKKTLSEIEPYLIAKEEVKKWPVTMLFETTANLYYYELNEQTTHFLKSKSDSLFSWIQALPEDLMFYKGSNVWLAANSHENYFIVDQDVANSATFQSILADTF